MGETGSPGRRLFHGGRIPLWVKLLYTAFLGVLLPYYWVQYTPVNFLWFCDVALLCTFLALWLESPLLASMPALASLIPDVLWIADFLSRLLAGRRFVISQTGYMFDPENSLLVRGLSFFHFWLPFLLLWLVWRLGYDRRALVAQTMLAGVVLLLSHALTDGPTGPPGNVNKVWGPSESETQTWMAAPLWLALLMLAYPICIFLPTHLVLGRLFRRRDPSVAVETP